MSCKRTIYIFKPFCSKIHFSSLKQFFWKDTNDNTYNDFPNKDFTYKMTILTILNTGGINNN